MTSVVGDSLLGQPRSRARETNIRPTTNVPKNGKLEGGDGNV